MFHPSQADVRRYFCNVYSKTRAGQILEPLEQIASLWIDEHPEYHSVLSDLPAALEALNRPTGVQNNPFLHLAMHLSISEQCSIDQPGGIRQAIELLTHRHDSLHKAHHEAMDCLGQMIADSQRDGKAPDAYAYIASVQRRATRD